jgi:hypothetical protein
MVERLRIVVALLRPELSAASRGNPTLAESHTTRYSSTEAKRRFDKY